MTWPLVNPGLGVEHLVQVGERQGLPLDLDHRIVVGVASSSASSRSPDARDEAPLGTSAPYPVPPFALPGTSPLMATPTTSRSGPTRTSRSTLVDRSWRRAGRLDRHRAVSAAVGGSVVTLCTRRSAWAWRSRRSGPDDRPDGEMPLARGGARDGGGRGRRAVAGRGRCGRGDRPDPACRRAGRRGRRRSGSA